MKIRNKINMVLLISTLFACNPKQNNPLETNVVLNNVSENMDSYNIVNLKLNILNQNIDIKNQIDVFESSLTIGSKKVAYNTHIISDTSKIDSTTFRTGYTSKKLGKNAVIEYGSMLNCYFNNIGILEQGILDIDLHEGAHIYYRNYIDEKYDSIRTEMFALLIEMANGYSSNKTFNSIAVQSNKYSYIQTYTLASKFIMSEFDQQINEYPVQGSHIPEISRQILKKEFDISLEEEIIHEPRFKSEKFFENNYLK